MPLSRRIGRQVLPERAAARDIEPGRRLIEEQHLGSVHQAAHDLELAAHAAGERPHRLLDLVRDPEQLREALHLLAVRGGHEAVARRVRVEPVQDRVEPDVLLRGEVHVEAGALEDDPDDPPYGARLAHDVVPVDRRGPAASATASSSGSRSSCVLPAPFGPSSAKNSPARTSNEMPSTALRSAFL